MDPEAYLEAAEGYVDAMFSGKRAGLRPAYDRLLALALALGTDVKACPGKTIVPLYREHVFAQIKPSTNARIDLGLALGDVKPVGRLVDTGGSRQERSHHPPHSDRDGRGRRRRGPPLADDGLRQRPLKKLPAHS